MVLFYLFLNRYEGTGRSLSLKLLQQLRSQTIGSNSHEKSDKRQNEKTVIGRQLHELTLEESIRYKPGDSVEQWLCDLLCLNATTNASVLSGCPPPDMCQLYYINRYQIYFYRTCNGYFILNYYIPLFLQRYIIFLSQSIRIIFTKTSGIIRCFTL